MVATVVEHLGAEGLTDQNSRELEKFLGQNWNIFRDENTEGVGQNFDPSRTLTQSPHTVDELRNRFGVCNEGALNRIQTHLKQVEARYAQSRISLAQMFPDIIRIDPFHSLEVEQEPGQAPSDILRSLVFLSNHQT
jgi:hypothetical protein